ncbi:MAG: zinc dependent phospholipase C family protein, partial [Proteobacteria bacterium]|nr:zinc dependent phospholipase C family protein [Pseudomonadota bacterium]
EFVLSGVVWAWGPAIHMAVACKTMGDLTGIVPTIAEIIRTFPLEYMYGSLSADFFVGKGQKKKEGHSHNWRTAYRLLDEARDDQETAYAYGFFSHLAADVIAHNYFVPNLIHQVSTWKRAGHLYWEAKADHSFGAVYMRVARDVLSMKQLGCDDLLKSAVGKGRNGLKAKRHIFTQTVKLSDFFYGTQPLALVNRGSRYRISPEYLSSMVSLSSRLVTDTLTHPESSPCLSYDPIGSKNLKLAGQHAILTRFFDFPRRSYLFSVDQELLEV